MKKKLPKETYDNFKHFMKKKRQRRKILQDSSHDDIAFTKLETVNTTTTLLTAWSQPPFFLPSHHSQNMNPKERIIFKRTNISSLSNSFIDPKPNLIQSNSFLNQFQIITSSFFNN